MQAIASLVDFVEQSARLHAHRVALVDVDGREFSYREVDELTDRIAGFLVANGVVAGDRVGVIMPKGATAILAFIGIMKCRAAYVPADYTAPAARNRSILSDCQVRVAFLSPHGQAIVDGWVENAPSAVVFVGDRRFSVESGVPTFSWTDAVSHDPARISGRSTADLAYILYTSGSTGVPKGVMLSHANAVSFVDWCSGVFAPVPDDRFSSHAPFHFDLSVLDIYVPLKHGAALHIVSEQIGKTPKDLAEFIATHQLTVWYSTPSILSLLAQFGELSSRDYQSLRLVLFAGEVFPIKHLRNVALHWPRPAYYNLYGPTETNVCTFAHVPTPVPDDRTDPYPIGFACVHCEPLVLDTDLRPVAAGDEGLLFIAGASVFMGYWNRPELNASVFVERGGKRWYNTGDVVRFEPEHGYIYVGRRDRMVKRRGYRIELGEIERGLYLHPSIAEAAVVAVPDESSGVRIMAFLSARAGGRPTMIDMKVFCSKNLPAYMSPDAFSFLDALPRTSTDKTDYQALTALGTAAAQVTR